MTEETLTTNAITKSHRRKRIAMEKARVIAQSRNRSSDPAGYYKMVKEEKMTKPNFHSFSIKAAEMQCRPNKLKSMVYKLLSKSNSL